MSVWRNVGVVLAAAAIACGGPTPEPRPAIPRRAEPPPQPQPPPAAPALVHPDTAAIDWSALDPRLDVQLDAAWRSLGIDGENWMDRVETIPRDPPAVRRAMASYHLRGGRFWCPTVQRTSGCATRSTFLPPSPTADIDDPCLRRDLALWALDQIPEEDIDGPLYAAYVELIKLRAPERELNQRALERLGDGTWLSENALWESMAAGNDEFVEANLDKLSPLRLVNAAREYHIDAALLALEPAAHLDTYVAALDQADLRFTTRVTVARRLVELLRDPAALPERARADALTDLRDFVRDHDVDCAVAGLAARLLPDPGKVVRRRPRTDDDVARLACTLLHAAGPRGAHWRRAITRHELTVINHLEDPTHDPPAWTETETRSPGAFFILPFATELERALPNCTDNVCRVPDSDVYFELELRRERNTGLRIHTIHRHERLGDEC
jgi:hypothetical protein